MAPKILWRTLLHTIFYVILFLLLELPSFAQTNPNHVYVRPHVRKDGTYVPGHYRTAPNKTNRDNFSTQGNVNPYTGKPGWIPPDNTTGDFSSISNGNNYRYKANKKDSKYFKRGLEFIKNQRYYEAINTADNISDPFFRYLIKFRAYLETGKTSEALLYVNMAKEYAVSDEERSQLDELIFKTTRKKEIEDNVRAKINVFNNLMDSGNFSKAINVAKEIYVEGNRTLSYLRNTYLAEAYTAVKNYQMSVMHIDSAISLTESIDQRKSLLEKKEYYTNLSNLKLNTFEKELETGDLLHLLYYYTNNDFYTLTTFLKSYNFQPIKSDLNNFSFTFERHTIDILDFNFVRFDQLQINDSITIKLIVLEYPHLKKHKEITDNLSKYRTITSSNNRTIVKEIVAKEYEISDEIVVFNGFEEDQENSFITGCYVVQKRGKNLKLRNGKIHYE